MSTDLLEVRSVACRFSNGPTLFHDVNLVVHPGDVIILQGKSGVGKSTFLKALAHLNLHDGDILFRGRKPKSYGVPTYRTHVQYVPQRPSLLPGTPREFLARISAFNSRARRLGQSYAFWPKHWRSPWSPTSSNGTTLSYPDDSNVEPGGSAKCIELSKKWGITEELWDRPWSNLSGGESQRIALAAAVGMDTAEVLLLDEPTSALDLENALSVEDYLRNDVADPNSMLKSIVWITHSGEQAQRVATRSLTLTPEGFREDSRVD